MRSGASTLFRAQSSLLVVVAACSSSCAASDVSSSAVACVVTRHIEMARDLVAPNNEAPRLAPFGDRFALLASSALTTNRSVDVALVSWQGLDERYRFALDGLCPEGVCRNVHGMALLATAAGNPEFLLVEQGSSVSMAAYPLRTLTWDAGESEPSATPLFDARVGAITTRSDMRSSNDAGRALFVSGNVDATSLQLALLREQGALVAPASTMTLPSMPWDCLALVPTEHAGAVSVVARPENGTEVNWSLRELDAESNVAFEFTTVVPVDDARGYTDCPRVVASTKGFHAQWVSSEGTSIVATLNRTLDVAPAATLLSLGKSPGSLEGVLQGGFLFRDALAAENQRLVRVTAEGESASAVHTLPPLATNAEVVRVAGPLVSVSYELPDARVFEELECP